MNIIDEFKNIKEYFSPKVISEVNEVYVKIAVIKGDKIPWHNHKNEDEFFYIIEGELLFEIENKQKFIMKQGDYFLVRKALQHKISAEKECKIMLIENKNTAHTGEVKSEITKSIQEQLK